MFSRAILSPDAFSDEQCFALVFKVKKSIDKIRWAVGIL